MKTKLIGVILLLVTFSMLVVLPKNIIAMPTNLMSDTTTHNDIIIDGTIGDDWFDGNKTYVPDPTNDGLASDANKWQLNGLYIAINNTGVAFGMNTTMESSANGWLLFIDSDMGSTGVSDFNVDDGNIPWDKRPYKFVSDFLPDHMFGAWGNNMSWDSGGQEYFYWTFFNITETGESPIDPSNGWKSRTINQSTTSGPSIFHYEGFVEWALLYPNMNNTHPVPANAELRVVAGFTKGDWEYGLLDTIPNQIDNSANEIKNYLRVQIDNDGDMKPDLLPEPTIGWAGNEADNSYSGQLPAGDTLETKISIWFTDSIHDHPNTSDVATLSYRLYDYDAGNTPGSWVNVTMNHQVGDYQGNNDWHRYQIDTSSYSENDTLEWFITTAYGETSKHNVTIGPLPPIDIGWVGAIDPSGGFKLPGEPIEIVCQIGQLLNGTDYIHNAPGTEVTLYYEENNSGTWLTKAFTFREEAGTQNDLFNVTIGPYAFPTNVTFYINATNNNTLLSSNITIYVLIPPPETTIFSMTDPSGDEYGVYPTDESFAPYEGLLDVLNFTVTGNAWVTTFHFQMRDNSNPWSGPSGFSHPTFIVMIDNAPGGSTDSFGNAYVNTNVEWDHGFQVTSWEKWYWTDSEHVQQSGTGISISTDLNETGNGYWISFSVPTYLTGGVADDTWKYVVMVGSNDFTNFRQHKSATEQWAFGGGNDGDVDPNFVDILVPEGGNSTWLQEYIANSYDVTTQTRATVMAVGPGITFVEDTTDPTVSITSPSDGATFNITSGTTYSLTVSWTVSDPDDATLSGLDRLEFFVDTVLQPDITIDNTSATLTLEPGTHTIRINVYDLTGNFASATITVTVYGVETTTTTTTTTPTTSPGFDFFGLLAMLGLAVMLTRRKK
ncbi:MAG: glucodextranase DOMON-like domain-containing protein [Candidatus Hodarchaeales archaeon]